MQNTKKLVITALFAAFIAILTLFNIPIPAGGYIHLGDAFIIAAVFLLGKYAIPAAAIGSALADTILGYFLPYAPITLVIKGLMAFVVFLIIGKKETMPRIIIAATVCEIIMAAGYFIVDIALYRFAGAVGTLVFSFIQAGAGIVIGSALCYIIIKTRLKDKLYIFD